jgi:hypothetical protein
MSNYLRRGPAAKYITEKGIDCSPKTLAKWAVVGGGPAFSKFGPWPIYEPPDLDQWIAEKTSPRVRSTSELRALSARGSVSALSNNPAGAESQKGPAKAREKDCRSEPQGER